MSNSAVTNYLSATAVQLAAFPSGLWSLVSQRKLPALPGKNDVLMGASQTILGTLIGVGSSAFVQNLQAKGTFAALTGSRLGLTQLNWSSLGSALVTGAAVGASIAIATYLSREGYKASVLSQERNTPTSQTNVSLQQMTKNGADAWSINRILEKDPKAMPRVQGAVVDHTMGLTHTNADDARVHSTIALVSAVVAKAGQFSPSVSRVKNNWYEATAKTLSDSPSAKLLFDALPQMPGLQKNVNVLDMHSSWTSMVSSQMSSPDKKSFDSAFSAWSTKYFVVQSPVPSLVKDEAFDGIRAAALVPSSVSQIQREKAQLDAMVASVLLDAPVAPKPSAKQEPMYLPSMELDIAP